MKCPGIIEASMKLTLAFCLSSLLFSADPRHFGAIRQLTEGGQNAEAYWSPDGKRLIFQSTRKGYECDQIFIMNADGSDQKLVSTGKGRTTCGLFFKGWQAHRLRSTHEAGEACPPSPDRSKGYVWGVFPATIFTLPLTLAHLEEDDGDARLRRRGYGGTGRPARLSTRRWGRAILDLWTMRQTGRTRCRSRHRTGYDGGAAFSRDGRKLGLAGQSSQDS